MDAAAGKVVWKARATGADKDVLTGPDFHPRFIDSENHLSPGKSRAPPLEGTEHDRAGWGLFGERRVVARAFFQDSERLKTTGEQDEPHLFR